MCSRPLLLVALAAAASACGGNSSSSGACPATPCQTGQTCRNGTCVEANGTPDGGGIAACTASDRKPIEDSVLLPGTTSTPGGPAFVLVSREQHQVGDTMTFNVPAGVASLTIVEQAMSAPDAIDSIQFPNVAVPHIVTRPGGTFQFNAVDNGQSFPPANADETANCKDRNTYCANRTAYWTNHYVTMPAYSFSGSPATGTLTFPNTTQGLDSGQLPQGKWSALVSDYAYECAAGQSGLTQSGSCPGSTTSIYQVTVIAKPVATAGTISDNGTINVVIYLVGSPDANPFTTAQVGTNCLNDPDLKRTVQSLQTLYNQVGLTANVTCADVDPAVRAAYSTVDITESGACAQLSQLFTYSAPGNTLNLFLVSHIKEPQDGSKTDTVGVDGTIPGPSSIGGTVASGAVVSIANLRQNSGKPQCVGTNYSGCGPDLVAYIMAHEGGHFLGLYHLTEQFSADFDTLAGTDACPCSKCSNTPSTCLDPATQVPPGLNADPMFASSCLRSPTCGGGDNLMFWVVEAASQGKLVDEQGRVMRANPLIQ